MNTPDAPVVRVQRCRVCGDDDWAEVHSFGLMPLANDFVDPASDPADDERYPLEVGVCRTCRLLSLRHAVDPERLFRDYAYETSESDTMDEHMGWVADECRRRFGLANASLVVEFGSNTGLQLRHFARLGMRVLGVDPARNLAETARANGVETWTDFFGEEVARRVRAQHGAAGLVLARHVFAHVDDLSDVLAGLRVLLGDSGVFAFEVPYLGDLLEGLQFDTIYHEHLSYFSLHTLEYLFRRNGMRLVDADRVHVHGGSLLVFAAPEQSGRGPSPTVADMLEHERTAGLTGAESFRNFTAGIGEAVTSLTSLVQRYTATGRTVAGYGAPAKGTTLLAACGLDSGNVSYCVDTTAAKQGRLTAGTRIPVRAPEEAGAAPPDCYLLLARTYREEILRNEKAYLEAGGAFVDPLPRPRLITVETLNSVT
ncbi:class I SAM-dependent methyltransferase [Streptomonospora arabica]|uniref:Methyltransferase domain-containing protein n=1 Tax=Streptomonospora arabica TaxID=412417 RepID=A0ABV9SHG0_9ACTN